MYARVLHVHKISRVGPYNGIDPEEEEQKSIFDRVWFGEKTAVLEGAATYSNSIPHVENDYYT